MEWWEYIIFFTLQLLVGLGGAWLYAYVKRDANNTSDSEYAEEISKLKKLGENAATKEDIKEITEKIETVKAEVSLEKQREHEFVKERHEHMLNLLRGMEELSLMSSSVAFYLYNIYDTDKLTSASDKVSEIHLNIVHEVRICNILFEDDKLGEKLYKCLDPLQEYVWTVKYVITNALVYINEYQYYRNRAVETNNGEFTKTAKETMDNLIKLREKSKSELNNEKVYDEIISFISIITKLYEQKFHIKLNYKPLSEKANDTL